MTPLSTAAAHPWRARWPDAVRLNRARIIRALTLAQRRRDVHKRTVINSDLQSFYMLSSLAAI